MPKCSYCREMYEIPRGLTYVLKDGTIKHLCSGKCRKNLLMKRRKVRWIIKGKKDGGDVVAELAEEAESEAKPDEKIETPKKEKTEKKAEEKSKEEKKGK